MASDSENLLRQISAVAASLEALKAKSASIKIDAKVWFNAYVRFHFVPVDSPSVWFTDSYHEVQGRILVDLNMIDHVVGADGSVGIRSWNNDDLLCIVRESLAWLPENAKADVSMFSLSSRHLDTAGRKVSLQKHLSDS